MLTLPLHDDVLYSYQLLDESAPRDFRHFLGYSKPWNTKVTTYFLASDRLPGNIRSFCK